MISVAVLKETARKTGLTLYQQEKDYLLKLFLYNYYTRYDDAVFKGGTCIRYLFGLNRFSEDLDFNISIPPERFQEQVEKTLEEIRLIGMDTYFLKDEQFEESYTCEIGFHGPLYRGTEQTRNKFRIDAWKRTGTVYEPEWNLIESEYPETKAYFLVRAMNEEEMMVEKILSLIERGKGRDLYDVWFLLKKGVTVDKELLRKKSWSPIQWDNLPSETEYRRDMERLTSRTIPYAQVAADVRKALRIL